MNSWSCSETLCILLVSASHKQLVLHEKALCHTHVHFKYKQACCRHNCVHVRSCMSIFEHSVHQSVCPHLRLLIYKMSP